MAAHKKTRSFVSYDYDNDLDLKNLLVGQSRHKDSPFFIEDWSIKREFKGGGLKPDAGFGSLA